VLIYSLITTVVAWQIHPAMAASEIPPAPEALKALEEALHLAEPGGFARIFLNEGEPMRSLLAYWLEQADQGSLREYGLRLLSQLKAESSAVTKAQPGASLTGGAAEGSNQALVEPLTLRELEILHWLGSDLTGPEIADRLVVSINTVRFHIKNIYQKLGVSSRLEVIRRAKELGL
jgi:LuxR family maltose regulon positive regulatory protein